MSFKRLEDDLNIIKNITGSADNNYGLSEEQMKSKFDEGSLKIQTHINEHIKELESQDAAKSIGYGGALGGDSHTVAEALDKLEQSGIGNIPPSNTITTEKIVNNAVTQEKLSESLNNRLDYLYSNLSKILIQNGAQGEIEGSEDLLLFGLNGELEEVYNLKEEKTEKKNNAGLVAHVPFNVEESLIMRSLGEEPISVDVLAAKTGFDAAKINSLAMSLRLKGRIRFFPGNRVALPRSE